MWTDLNWEKTVHMAVSPAAGTTLWKKLTQQTWEGSRLQAAEEVLGNNTASARAAVSVARA